MLLLFFQLNGVIAKLPVHLKSQGIVIYQHGFYTTLETDIGLTVSYDDHAHSLFVTVSPKYQGRMCGLCGNFRGIKRYTTLVPEDSTPLNDGIVQTSAYYPEKLGKVLDSAVDKPTVTVSEFEEERLVEAKAICWSIKDPEGPFASCHSKVDPEPYLTNCIVDVYASAGNITIACQSISAYVAVCQRANGTVLPWREANFCGKLAYAAQSILASLAGLTSTNLHYSL